MCVRIDSYESEVHQKYVRTFLDGRFENSAFCLLAPNGVDWLSKGGRGPEMVLGRRSAAERMDTVAALYPVKAEVRNAIVPDFHSVRQALNVASADQRVLVVVHGSQPAIEPLRTSLRTVVSDERIIGRFHFDFETDSAWKKNVSSLEKESGIALIKSGEFGMKGTVMEQLPLDADKETIIETLLAANMTFAETTEKKVYSDHVAKGRKEGIYFEGAVPYGEDRNADGLVDRILRGGGQGPSRSRGGFGGSSRP